MHVADKPIGAVVSVRTVVLYLVRLNVQLTRIVLCVGLCHVLVRLPHDKVAGCFDGLCWLQVEQLDRLVSSAAHSLEVF